MNAMSIESFGGAKKTEYVITEQEAHRIQDALYKGDLTGISSDDLRNLESYLSNTSVPGVWSGDIMVGQ